MDFRDTPRFTPRWWLSLPFTAKDIYKRLSSPDYQVNSMTYWWHGGLERMPVESVLPNAERAELRLHNPGWREPGTSTTLFELNCILMAMHHVKAKSVIEIGTFNGNTTLNLAANVPEDGRVVTIDLPVDEHVEYDLEVSDGMRNVTDRRIVGEQFKGHPLESRIQQVFGDSAKLDFSTLGGPFDFAFIDGCHDYNYVVKDTENITKVMRPGGCVMWHDYAEMGSVSRAVDEFRGRFNRLCAIEGTRLAVGFTKA